MQKMDSPPQSSSGPVCPSSSLDLQRFLSSRHGAPTASPILRASSSRTAPLSVATARAGTARTGLGSNRSARARDNGRASTGRTNTPRTSTARTGTARTATARTRAQTARCEDAYVVAIIDNAVREVGLCAHDLNGFVVELRQFTDSNMYTTLIKVLCVLSPVEILLSTSSIGGLLVQAIQNSPHISHVKLTYVGRAFFNETYGDLAVEKLSNQQCPHLARLGSALYLSLACCGALLKYIEHVEDRLFAPASLHIHFKPNDDTMFFDMSALEGLEVIENVNAAVGLSEPHQSSCLLRVMDRTVTRAGKRFLRRAVLEPSADLGTISIRQDAVEELINSGVMFQSFNAALRKFPDLEKAMAILMSRENARLRSMGTAYEPEPQLSDYNQSEAELVPEPEESVFVQGGPPSPVLIRTVLNIKASLEAVTELLGIVEDFEAPLLRRIAQSMRNPALMKLREEIEDVIDPDISLAKNHERMRINGALAVKHGRNGYLDIHRKTMGENIEDMEILVDEARKKHGLHQLELTLHMKRGYHFTIPNKTLKARSVPSEFILISSGKKLHHFTSPQMERLNVLYKYSMNEIWRTSELELGNLVTRVFQPQVLTAIHRLCDCIAILDCLGSFVTYSTEHGEYIERPTMGEDGPIDLKDAYHPISLSNALRHGNARCTSIVTRKPVPNDVFLDETNAVHIISGRNQAGKSFFLKTVGLIVIMAHTGCWVPAKPANIRILKRIATRFETGYDISRRQSSFSKEMQDIAAVFDSVNYSHRNVEKALQAQEFQSRGISDAKAKGGRSFPNTLIIIDELCRYTSTVDGFSIAYAVLEELAAIPNALTLCTTHFHGLGALAHVNPVVSNFHLVAECTGASKPNSDELEEEVVGNVKYKYKVSAGVVPENSYGMETARLAGFPEEVLQRSEILKKIVPSQHVSTMSSVLKNILVVDHVEKNLLRKSIQTVSIARRISDIKRSAVNSSDQRRLLAEYQEELLERAKRNRVAKKLNQGS
eukprot:TRINITY_DN295_c0_g1_i2.p1 TRINITY_DN295_c0_g1~~TRINITY_DN295_c0_g1_i2.p1  ORF type:complete len:1000 (+),score=134.62 TRINITY_DN295_c0_g1_i2:6734-9733(+)